LDTSENILLSVFSQSTAQQVNTAVAGAVDYIQAKYPDWKGCPLGDLRSWLLWHWILGLIGVVGQAKRICGLVVVRLLEDPADYSRAYRHSANGKICYVELVAADSTDALRAAVNSLRFRHGNPDWLLFERGHRSARPKLYPWKRFDSLLAYVRS
jgi:hypothetical protein